MDAFFAAVEVRDNPELMGKPLIIGALPSERGVVSTCSYEARKYGVRSAMSIKEAYRRCPHGIYMHPNGHKYVQASKEIKKIWLDYTDIVEFVSIDEGFLDVTNTSFHFGSAEKIGLSIKERTMAETGLTCSVGIGYTLMSAKIASEEKKPDGFYMIPDAGALKRLIIDRNVRVIYGIGPKTADVLSGSGITTVRDLLENKQAVRMLLGSHGQHFIDLAQGKDERRVTPNSETEAKSISRETTFQQDITDFDYLKDALRLLTKKLSMNLRNSGIYARTVTLKVKYSNMKQITRSKSGDAINRTSDIYKVIEGLIDTVEKRPIRLVGVGLSGFEDAPFRQISIDDSGALQNIEKDETLDRTLLELQRRFGSDIIKTGSEVIAEKRFKSE